MRSDDITEMSVGMPYRERDKITRKLVNIIHKLVNVFGVTWSLNNAIHFVSATCKIDKMAVRCDIPLIQFYHFKIQNTRQF